MKRFCLLIGVASMLTLTSCVKKIVENTKNNPATDFSLVLTRTDANGNVNKQYENALNMPGSAVFTANYYEKESSVHLKIGGIQVNTVVPRLYSNVYFKFTRSAEQIAGTYNFPADIGKVDFSLAEQIGTVDNAVGVPKSGQLQVTYDAAAKTISGTITNISFNAVLDGRYTSEVLSGSFKNVALGK